MTANWGGVMSEKWMIFKNNQHWVVSGHHKYAKFHDWNSALRFVGYHLKLEAQAAIRGKW